MPHACHALATPCCRAQAAAAAGLKVACNACCAWCSGHPNTPPAAQPQWNMRHWPVGGYLDWGTLRLPRPPPTPMQTWRGLPPCLQLLAPLVERAAHLNQLLGVLTSAGDAGNSAVVAASTGGGGGGNSGGGALSLRELQQLTHLLAAAGRENSSRAAAANAAVAPTEGANGTPDGPPQPPPPQRVTQALVSRQKRTMAAVAAAFPVVRDGAAAATWSSGID